MGRLASGKLLRASVSAGTWTVGIAAVAVAAFALLIFWRGRPFRSQAQVGEKSTAPLPALVHFSVPFQEERAEFDLNFAPNTRYLLVVGSLGSAESRCALGCSSRKVPAARFVPVDRIPTLSTLPAPVKAENRVAPSRSPFREIRACRQMRHSGPRAGRSHSMSPTGRSMTRRNT